MTRTLHPTLADFAIVIWFGREGEDWALSPAFFADYSRAGRNGNFWDGVVQLRRGPLDTRTRLRLGDDLDRSIRQTSWSLGGQPRVEQEDLPRGVRKLADVEGESEVDGHGPELVRLYGRRAGPFGFGTAVAAYLLGPATPKRYGQLCAAFEATVDGGLNAWWAYLDALLPSVFWEDRREKLHGKPPGWRLSARNDYDRQGRAGAWIADVFYLTGGAPGNRDDDSREGERLVQGAAPDFAPALLRRLALRAVDPERLTTRATLQAEPLSGAQRVALHRQRQRASACTAIPEAIEFWKAAAREIGATPEHSPPARRMRRKGEKRQKAERRAFVGGLSTRQTVDLYARKREYVRYLRAITEKGYPNRDPSFATDETGREVGKYYGGLQYFPDPLLPSATRDAWKASDGWPKRDFMGSLDGDDSGVPWASRVIG